MLHSIIFLVIVYLSIAFSHVTLGPAGFIYFALHLH